MMLEIPINQGKRIDIYGPYPKYCTNGKYGDEKPLISDTFHMHAECIGQGQWIKCADPIWICSPIVGQNLQNVPIK